MLSVVLWFIVDLFGGGVCVACLFRDRAARVIQVEAVQMGLNFSQFIWGSASARWSPSFSTSL